jgi:hypothetical protein
MKTAQEWVKSKTHCPNDKNVVTDRFKEFDIVAIQTDSRADLLTRIQSLEATIEACRSALERLNTPIYITFQETDRLIAVALRLIHESQHKGGGA